MKIVQGNVSVTTSSTPLLGPHPQRKALLISAPQQQAEIETDASVLTKGADSSTTGVKSSFVVPAGKTATLVSAAMNETTGTTVVAALEVVKGGNTIALASFTQKGNVSLSVPLSAGDTVQWDVTTAVALSITDFFLGVELDVLNQYVTIQWGDKAVLDGGIDLYPGAAPLYLTHDMMGDALREPWSAIASVSTAKIGTLDFFK